jgi:hypothetical protein
MTRHNWRPAFWALIFGWALAGCATRDSGYKISNETIAFIQPGVTTRSEVIENLGTPLLELKGPRVVAYSWGKMRATGGGTQAVRDQTMGGREMGYGVGTAPTEETGLVETRRWVCCIALDDKDRVARVDKIKLEGATSLEKAVRQWAGTRP